MHLNTLIRNSEYVYNSEVRVSSLDLDWRRTTQGRSVPGEATYSPYTCIMLYPGVRNKEVIVTKREHCVSNEVGR